jgi:hypothetical protein
VRFFIWLKFTVQFWTGGGGMPALFSTEGKLLAGLERRRMTVEAFAKVAALDGIRGASKTRLNESFRDAGALDNGVAQQCWKLWAEIEGLCMEFEPLILDLRDGDIVHQWLQRRRAGELNFSNESAFVTGAMKALQGLRVVE